MRNISLEINDKDFYKFNRIIPLSRSQFHFKPDENTENRQLEPIDEGSHFSLLKSLGNDAIELTFSSISDVSIECVRIYDEATKRMVKALLLSVSNVIGKRKFYLIDLKDLIASFSKPNEGILSDSKYNFVDLYHNLSLREQKVLREVSKGKTSSEIARKLFISTNTVKNHRKNIKKKLHFEDNQDYSKFLKWSLEYCGKEH